MTMASPLPSVPPIPPHKDKQSLDLTVEAHRRSASNDSTPKPTPRAPGLANAGSIGSAAQDGHQSSPESSSSGPVKRLGFFTEKLTGSQSSNSQRPTTSATGSTAAGTTGAATTMTSSSSTTGQSLWPPRTHSRADSALLQSVTSREPVASSPAPSSILSSTSTLVAGASPSSKTSPSKASSGRTYDAKLVSREMHRLGNLGHLPSAMGSSSAAASSSTTLQLPASSISAPPSASNLQGENPWGSLHVHVLPLFNGEPLRIPIEDLNSLVRKHIQAVLSLSPSKALNTLEHDATDLIAAGMITLNAKLSGVDENKLLGRVVEIWGFFWDQVLPYVEGVFFPLQTDPLLSSLYRTPKSHRASSPSRSGSLSSLLLQSTYHIDVRQLALRSFRDKIILPVSARLLSRLTLPKEDNFPDNSGYQQPRLQQMLLVLVSQAHHSVSMSLTPSAYQPTLGEKAVADLLRVVRAPPLPIPSSSGNGPSVHNHESVSNLRGRAPSFLSQSLPRDRRGRISTRRPSVMGAAVRGFGIPTNGGIIEGNEGADGGETPRNGFQSTGTDAEREFLESLRAIRNPESELAEGASEGAGGWGLGGGGNEDSKVDDLDDEDEALDWDQAQAVVERMVGMKPTDAGQPETRRRMT